MLLPMFRLFFGASGGSQRRLKKEIADVESAMSSSDRRAYWSTVVKVSMLSVLYVLSLEYLPVDYRWLTMGFIGLFGVSIGTWRIVLRSVRPLPMFFDVVVLVPFWIYAVFQSGLHIELP